MTLCKMNKFSVKKPRALLWKTGYSLTSVQDLIDKDRLDQNDLICPFGEAERAITINDFLANTSIFDRSESKPNFVEEVDVPKHARVIKSGWILFICASLALLLVSFFLVGVTPHDIVSEPRGFIMFIGVIKWIEVLTQIAALLGGLTIVTGYILKLYQK